MGRGRAVGANVTFSSAVFLSQGSQRIVLFSLRKLRDVVLLMSVLKKMIASDI